MARKKRIEKTQEITGGEWQRADLHLHTPASADWQEPGVTYLQWLQKAESKGLDIVAITDHNTVEGIAQFRAEIERLAWLEANQRLRPQERRDLDEYRRLGEKILVLPGFEFTATFGFHVLAIFPPAAPLRTLELLLLRLNVPIEKVAEGSTEIGASTDVLTAYRLIREAGGLVIAAHANTLHGVAMRGLGFGGQTKIAYTQDPNLHALEVTDLEGTGRRVTARFFDGSKPEYPRRMHCIQGSDAHRLNRDPKDRNRLGIGDRVTELWLPEVTFETLKAVFEGSDFTRTRPYRPIAEEPFDYVQAAREEGNNIVQVFHENMARQGGRLHKVLCDVVAFANTRGGTLYIGVSSARKGVPKGVENPNEAVALLKREVERNITPPLDCRVDVLFSQGIPVVRVSVPDGLDKPYVLGQTRIYVRQEAETNEAVRDEIVQLALSRRRPAAAASGGGVESVAVPAEAFISVSAATSGRSAEIAAAEEAVETAAEAVREEPLIPVWAAAPETVASVEGLKPQVLYGRPEAVVEPEAAPEAVPGRVEPAIAPAIGVEIVSTEERKGTRYFSIRDLRNCNTIRNVTLASARKLWSYAINQCLANPVDEAKVIWSGDYGLWQVAKRARKWRYDLVRRQSDGGLRVFYGVTADGMAGPWAQFLKEEDRAE